MITYMLDTNMASYAIKDSYPAVSVHLARVPIEQITISAVTVGELIFGVKRKPEATRLAKLVSDFLLHMTVLPWDSEVAQAYGTVRAMLERQGNQMGVLDTMIGVHALSLGAVLVTHDGAFKRIQGLTTEDWVV